MISRLLIVGTFFCAFTCYAGKTARETLYDACETRNSSMIRHVLATTGPAVLGLDAPEDSRGRTLRHRLGWAGASQLVESYEHRTARALTEKKEHKKSHKKFEPETINIQELFMQACRDDDDDLIHALMRCPSIIRLQVIDLDKQDEWGDSPASLLREKGHVCDIGYRSATSDEKLRSHERIIQYKNSSASKSSSCFGRIFSCKS